MSPLRRASVVHPLRGELQVALFVEVQFFVGDVFAFGPKNVGGDAASDVVIEFGQGSYARRVLQNGE